MNKQAKPIFALIFGAILLLSLFCSSVQAQNTVISSGTSTLAPSVIPVGGYGANPQEYLSISWSVMENASDIFTYSYTVNNPVGDVLLNDNGTLTTTPEIVDNFEVTFLPAVQNGYLPGTQAGGAFDQVTSVGLTWDFNAINPGGSSAILSFQSDLGPGSGNASADGANSPAPWASTGLNGQQVPVPMPRAVPEPATTALLALTLLLLPLRSALRRFT